MKRSNKATHTFEITFDAVGGDQYHAAVTVASEWDGEDVTHDVTIGRIVNDHGQTTDGRVTGEQYAAIVASAEAAMNERLSAEADRDDQPFDTLEERADYYGE